MLIAGYHYRLCIQSSFIDRCDADMQFLTTFVSMCWGIGAFLAAGILRGTLNLPGDAAWKVPYALQWIWPIPLFIIAWMAPESKWCMSYVQSEADPARSILPCP
jgi:hypothetical protein